MRSLFFPAVACASILSTRAIGVAASALPLGENSNSSQAIPTVSANPRKLAPALVSTELFERLRDYAKYAQASYCRANDLRAGFDTSRQITCPTSLVCSNLGNPQIQIVHGIPGNTPGKITSFVAVDHTRAQIIVAMRGTRGFRDLETDLMFTTQESTNEICAGCALGRPALALWRNSAAEILDNTVLPLTKAFETYTVAFVGHSLGAAVATVAVADIISRRTALGYDRSLFLYSFGSPRVGNPAFSDFMTLQPNLFRVTHDYDIIPHLPPINNTRSGTQYFWEHHAPEYFIDGPGPLQTAADTTELGPDPRKTVNPNENDDGDASDFPGIGKFRLVDTHQEYIIKISGNSVCGD